jgi:glucose-fructose oxidoreductase
MAKAKSKTQAKAKNPKRSAQITRSASAKRKSNLKRSTPTIRYAVVGLGHIAQVAVLPAFRNAKNSKLVALISSDEKKMKVLSKKYGVEYTADYENYEKCLREADVDAVYIALPNSLHHDYVVRAARMGIHVLCEKPLGVTSEECREMIEAAREAEVKLMTAYRLHFDPANLSAIETIQSGKIGEPRLFHSVFAFRLSDPENIRLQSEEGVGPLHDIGVYCLNAARYLFRSEPIETSAMLVHGADPKFTEVPESMSVLLKFPDERLASFLISFNTEAAASYEVLGTKGKIRLDPAYEYAEPLESTLTIKDKTRTKKFAKRDQFGPELVYFSDCILNDREVEPSGIEGWKDVRILEAILESAKTGQHIRISLDESGPRPDESQKITRPGFSEPKLVNVTNPSD